MKQNAFILVALVCIITLGCIAYFNTLDGDWVWDDVSSVLLHQHVQEPAEFFQLFKEDQHAFGRGQGNFYRPLVAASFMWDFWLSHDPVQDTRPGQSYPEVSPFLFHCTNIIWHVAAAVLLCCLLVRFGAPRFVSLVVPLIFVVHPLHTEAVAYISGRADMMSAVFIFAALFFAFQEGTSQKRIAGIVLSTIVFGFGLLSKESTLIYPLLLVLFIALLPYPEFKEKKARKDAIKQRLTPLFPAVVVILIYIYLRSTVLRFADMTVDASPFLVRIVETFQSFAIYIRLLFIPTGLHMERTLDHAGVGTAVIGAVLLLLSIALFVWAIKVKKHRIALGMGWFLLAWLPISGIFPLNAPLAEHWMYVPMAGFWWALVELLYAYTPATIQWRRTRTALVTGLCLVFVLLTVERNDDWQNNDRLFRATLAQNPNTIRVHYNLAVTYEDLEGNLSGARRHYEHVLALYRQQKVDNQLSEDALLPEEIDVYLSLGKIHFHQQDYERSRSELAYLLNAVLNESSRDLLSRFRQEVASAAMWYGKSALAMGEIAEAEMSFRQAVTLIPEFSGEVDTLLTGAPI